MERNLYEIQSRIDRLLSDCSSLEGKSKLNMIYLMLQVILPERKREKLYEEKDVVGWRMCNHDDNYREIKLDGTLTHYNRFCMCCPGWMYDSDYKEGPTVLGNIFTDGIDIIYKKVDSGGNIIN